jgi:hypothetical protein
MWIDDTVYFRSDRNGEWLERHSASHHHHGLLAELMHRQAWGEQIFSISKAQAEAVVDPLDNAGRGLDASSA